jgi:hypothetical protein
MDPGMMCFGDADGCEEELSFVLSDCARLSTDCLMTGVHICYVNQILVSNRGQ